MTESVLQREIVTPTPSAITWIRRLIWKIAVATPDVIPTQVP